MATFAIGDIQGCFASFQQLLELIQFHPENDTLWLTGDLVNRGPQSLEVLRFVRMLGDRHIVVLGNHDLHLIAMAYGVRQQNKEDTVAEILTAKDKHELIDWLRSRPLLYHHTGLDFVMTHAGLAPAWPLSQAKRLANEVEMRLRDHSPVGFLKNLYGNEPSQWNESLSGYERWRCIINYFTRMRFCHRDGSLDFSYKGDIANKPHHLLPWFEIPHRVNANDNIIFGHWAALGGQTKTPHVFPLDTGCIWGNCLTAMRLEDQQRFQVKCLKNVR